MKQIKMNQALLPVVVFSCLATTVLAQAPVSDVSVSPRRVEVTEGSGKTYGTSTAVSDTSSSDGSAAQGGSMFQQMQQMRQEIATLRGQLEEQSYELQKLKQQHQEDFANLDGRLAGNSTPSNTAASANASSAPVAASNTAGAAAGNGASTAAGNGDGREEYEAAYALLKAKEYSSATSAFKNFVAKYPRSEYAGNSWFWLGFVYQTQGDMDSAAKSFSSLIEQFPKHAKVDDARYNLGKIYHQQGKNDQARALLKEVAAGSSKSAPLAKSYLESM